MRTAFCILMNLVGFAISAGYPFLAVLRGKKLARSILQGWGGLLIWIAFFSLGVPLVAHCFSHEVAREMERNWVPEPTGIVPVALLGWWPPLVAAGVALGARRVLRKLSPRTG